MAYLDEHRVHPTVDKIYADLVKEMPTLSKTTVYNTLKSLAEAGLIANLTISGHEARFDYNVDPHAHFMCKKCGRVIDIERKRIRRRKKEVQGNKVEEIHVYYKGICKKCLG